MSNICSRALLLSISLASASLVYAEVGNWYVVPMAAYTDDDGDRNIDDSIAGGQANIGRPISKHLSAEGMLGYSKFNGYPGQTHFEAGFNVLGFIERSQVFAPYIVVGLGVLNAEIEGVGGETSAVSSLGVGIQWNLERFPVSVRAEYRARSAFENNNNLTDRISTLGIQYGFGDDGFGNHFTSDDALTTGPGTCRKSGQLTAADVRDCGPDSDDDGVPEYSDVCPNTRSGYSVDVFGCRRDDDRDSVSDDKDRCLGTRARAHVDQYGCELIEGESQN